MKYFTIDELCASDTAERKKIDNATNANVTVSAPTRSAAADAAVASDVDLG